MGSGKGPAKSYGQMTKLRRERRIQLRTLFQEAAKLAPLISVDRNVMSGAPCIKGTRIPVWCVLNSIANHGSIGSVRRVAYRQLTDEQVLEAVWFAAYVIECNPAEGDRG